MNLKEQEKFIKECMKKNYLFISPSIIRGGEMLIYDNSTLKLYNNMDTNTKEFANKEIFKARYDDDNESKFNLYLIFCGDFDNLKYCDGEFIDFIICNKEKIVGVYKHVKSFERRDFFLGFAQSEIIYKYGFLYLNLEILLEEFKNNNIEFKVDTSEDIYNYGINVDPTSTRFVIRYKEKREVTTENNQQLKKK